jgi:transposase InsO family protein
VGWSAAAGKATALVLGALEMGLWQRDREGQEREGLIHHSDAGSQRHTGPHTALGDRRGVQQGQQALLRAS